MYSTLTVDALVFKAALKAAREQRQPDTIADLLLASLRPSLLSPQGGYAPARNPFAIVLDDERHRLEGLL